MRIGGGVIRIRSRPYSQTNDPTPPRRLAIKIYYPDPITVETLWTQDLEPIFAMELDAAFELWDDEQRKLQDTINNFADQLNQGNNLLDFAEAASQRYPIHPFAAYVMAANKLGLDNDDITTAVKSPRNRRSK